MRNDVFICHCSVMGDLVEVSPEEALFFMMAFFEKQRKQQICDVVGVSEDKVLKLCKFSNEFIIYWIKLLHDNTGNSDQLNEQVSEMEMAILWGVVSCYPYLPYSQDSLVLIKDLIVTIDQLLETEIGKD